MQQIILPKSNYENNNYKSSFANLEELKSASQMSRRYSNKCGDGMETNINNKLRTIKRSSKIIWRESSHSYIYRLCMGHTYIIHKQLLERDVIICEFCNQHNITLESYQKLNTERRHLKVSLFLPKLFNKNLNIRKVKRRCQWLKIYLF